MIFRDFDPKKSIWGPKIENEKFPELILTKTKWTSEFSFNLDG